MRFIENARRFGFIRIDTLTDVWVTPNKVNGETGFVVAASKESHSAGEYYELVFAETEAEAIEAMNAIVAIITNDELCTESGNITQEYIVNELLRLGVPA